MDELRRIRGSIDGIDDGLVSLLKSRYELARQLGRVKRARKLAFRDTKRERSILERVQRVGNRNGLPTSILRRVFLQIFDLAVDAQRSTKTRQDLEGVEVLVAGGTGGMGRLIANITANHGASVRIFGRTASRSRQIARELGVLPGSYSDARHADIVLVSVPIEVTAKVSLKLGSVMKPNSLLADLSSVKTGIADKIAKGTDRSEYVSLHPLFSPDLSHILGQQIIAISYRSGHLWKRLFRVFVEEGADVYTTTSRAHDMAMAQVQALHHYALICLGVAMTVTVGDASTRSLRITEEQILRLSKNWDTVMGIQMLNPFALRERRAFARKANNMVRMTLEDAEDALRTITAHVQNWTRKR